MVFDCFGERQIVKNFLIAFNRLKYLDKNYRKIYKN